VIVPVASGTAALCLLIASGVDASGLDFPSKYARSLSPDYFVGASYSVGTAETATEAYAGWSVELDEPGPRLATLAVEFVARQKSLPSDISQIVTRRLGEMLE
jgi:hypothetical protein